MIIVLNIFAIISNHNFKRLRITHSESERSKSRNSPSLFRATAFVSPSDHQVRPPAMRMHIYLFARYGLFFALVVFSGAMWPDGAWRPPKPPRTLGPRPAHHQLDRIIAETETSDTFGLRGSKDDDPR